MYLFMHWFKILVYYTESDCIAFDIYYVPPHLWGEGGHLDLLCFFRHQNVCLRLYKTSQYYKYINLNFSTAKSAHFCVKLKIIYIIYRTSFLHDGRITCPVSNKGGSGRHWTEGEENQRSSNRSGMTPRPLLWSQTQASTLHGGSWCGHLTSYLMKT